MCMVDVPGSVPRVPHVYGLRVRETLIDCQRGCIPYVPLVAQTSAWSACSDHCSLPSISYQSRAVQCVEVSSSGTASISISSECVSRGLVPPPSVIECDPTPCLGVFWQAANDWSPCSAPCVTNTSDPLSLGVTRSSPPRCMRAVNGTTQAVEESLCGPQTMVRGRACARLGGSRWMQACETSKD
jgi:hypothetical protein